MKKLLKFWNTPARLVIAVALLILVGEFLIMLLIENIQGSILNDQVLERQLFEFIDPLLLILLVSPALFLLIVKPMRAQQAALQKSETEYRRFIENLQEGIWMIDQDAGTSFVNPSMAQMLGYSVEEMQGRHFFSFMDEHGKTVATQNLLRGKQGIRERQDVELLRKDGGRIYTLMATSPILDEAGNYAGTLAGVTDITERKQAEKRRAMEHAVTRVLAEAETVADAMPRIIQTICENLGWACGAHWRWDEKAEVLRCAETWHIRAAEVAEFIVTASTTINEAPAWRNEAPRAKTGGLVRRVWMDGAPVWFPDVAQVLGFRRGPIAAKAGLHSAFGFPVMDAAQPLGVMEFFGRTIEQPDAVLLQTVGAIGSQIGQFVARRQAEELIRYLAKYDELTGLPNRNMFHDRLQHAFAQVQRHARLLAILFIDLDRFKNINDTLGHEAGDQVLMQVAQRLRGCLRHSDTVGRLGGDEFVMLIEDLPRLADAAAVAQKILDAVARPFLLDAQELHIGASIGISVYPEDGKDPQTLLQHADAAMYRAKERGKNNFQHFSPQLTAPSIASSELLSPVDTSGSRTKE